MEGACSLKEVKLETPAEIEAAISTISSLAAHLMNLRDTSWAEVAISPAGKRNWQVAVRYEGFVMSASATTLSEAIRKMLTDLTNRVAKRLEEGQELLKQ